MLEASSSRASQVERRSECVLQWKSSTNQICWFWMSPLLDWTATWQTTFSRYLTNWQNKAEPSFSRFISPATKYSLSWTDWCCWTRESAFIKVSAFFYVRIGFGYCWIHDVFEYSDSNQHNHLRLLHVRDLSLQIESQERENKTQQHCIQLKFTFKDWKIIKISKVNISRWL